jgi:hypothetical protein
MFEKYEGRVTRVRLWIGLSYWLLVLSIFVTLPYADPRWSEGGVPLIILKFGRGAWKRRW